MKLRQLIASSGGKELVQVTESYDTEVLTTSSREKILKLHCCRSYRDVQNQCAFEPDTGGFGYYDDSGKFSLGNLSKGHSRGWPSGEKLIQDMMSPFGKIAGPSRKDSHLPPGLAGRYGCGRFIVIAAIAVAGIVAGALYVSETTKDQGGPEPAGDNEKDKPLMASPKWGAILYEELKKEKEQQQKNREDKDKKPPKEQTPLDDTPIGPDFMLLLWELIEKTQLDELWQQMLEGRVPRDKTERDEYLYWVQQMCCGGMENEGYRRLSAGMPLPEDDETGYAMMYWIRQMFLKHGAPKSRSLFYLWKKGFPIDPVDPPVNAGKVGFIEGAFTPVKLGLSDAI